MQSICFCQNLLYVTTGDTDKPSLLDGNREVWVVKVPRVISRIVQKNMFSFKVKEVHPPWELAQLEHREIIWMMSKTYMKTLTYVVWLEIFHHSRLFTSSPEPHTGIQHYLHPVNLIEKLHCHKYRNLWCLRQ